MLRRKLKVKVKLKPTSFLSIFGIFFIFYLSSVYAAGFEKSILWSAHWGALGGAAASSVEGAEALYFNPAGLAGVEGVRVNINGSATWDQFKTPIVPAQSQISSNTELSIPYAAFISYGVTPKFGIGAGIYTAGGTRVEYDHIDWSTLNSNLALLQTTDKASLTLTEISIGAGYEILEGLKLGASYRILLGSLDLQYSGVTSLGGNNYALAQYNLNGMSGSRFNGFRAGIQYTPKDAPYGIGIEWRSEVAFTLSNSSISSTFLAPALGLASPTSFNGNGASLSNTSPQNLSIGAHYELIPNQLRLLTEYTFTEYHDEKSLNIQGSTTGNPIPGGNNFPNIYELWNNMSNIQVGIELKGISNLALRGGYIWTSQVVPNSNANPLFSTPGSGNTAALGVGAPLCPSFTLDGALEYSWANGAVLSSDNPTLTTQLGDYSTHAYVIHLSATYSL
jgi:long-chain fatty acid transport protein